MLSPGVHCFHSNRNECHTTQLSIVLLFLYNVRNIDFSISRVVIHGHIFSHCLTTGRGPGVGNAFGINATLNVWLPDALIKEGLIC